MPPSAFSKTTAISTVGVEARPALTTSMPQALRVPQTISSTMGPEMRASRPTTTLSRRPPLLRCSMELYADTNFTMSRGVSASPQVPPIVPLIPEIDLISVIAVKF